MVGLKQEVMLYQLPSALWHNFQSYSDVSLKYVYHHIGLVLSLLFHVPLSFLPPVLSLPSLASVLFKSS